jgi:hypothetical protein
MPHFSHREDYVPSMGAILEGEKVPFRGLSTANEVIHNCVMVTEPGKVGANHAHPSHMGSVAPIDQYEQQGNSCDQWIRPAGSIAF